MIAGRGKERGWREGDGREGREEEKEEGKSRRRGWRGGGEKEKIERKKKGKA